MFKTKIKPLKIMIISLWVSRDFSPQTSCWKRYPQKTSWSITVRTKLPYWASFLGGGENFYIRNFMLQIMFSAVTIYWMCVGGLTTFLGFSDKVSKKSSRDFQYLLTYPESFGISQPAWDLKFLSQINEKLKMFNYFKWIPLYHNV